MGKLINFFSRVSPEDPICCCCLPIKYIVAFFQIVSIVGVVTSVLRDPSVLGAISAGGMLFFLIISFCVYVYELENMMKLHVWIGAIVTILFTGFFIFQVFFLVLAPTVEAIGKDLDMELESNKTGEVYMLSFYSFYALSPTTIVIGGLIQIAMNIVYLWMCSQLVKAVHHKISTLRAVRGPAHKLVF